MIVGDNLEYYYDLAYMQNKAGYPSTSNFLFVGDYVDGRIIGLETSRYQITLITWERLTKEMIKITILKKNKLLLFQMEYP